MPALRLTRLRSTPLPWPLPALRAWLAGWLVWWAFVTAGMPPAVAIGGAFVASGWLAWRCDGLRRRLLALAGFPVSATVLGVAAVPAAVWLLLALPLLLLYPLRAWRDAPLFPTPAGALDGLDGVVGVPRRVLDAGCGLGHGLAALHRLWPQAELYGVEWSPLLAGLAARRCRWAQVRRGDMWSADWSGFDLVYLFQRPESMARAWAKAERELAAGAWLVSLEFPVPDVPAQACLRAPGRREVWIYRVGAAAAPSIGGRRGR